MRWLRAGIAVGDKPGLGHPDYWRLPVFSELPRGWRLSRGRFRNHGSRHDSWGGRCRCGNPRGKRGRCRSFPLKPLKAPHQALSAGVKVGPGRLEQSNFDCESGFVAATDRCQSSCQFIDRANQVGRTDRLGLGGQPGGVGGGHGECLGNLPRGSRDQQYPQMSEQVTSESGRIPPAAGHGVDRKQNTLRIFRDHRVNDAEEKVGIRSSEQLEHVIDRD